MQWIDIFNRIVQGENEQTEFKRWSGDLRQILRSVCAMANTSGGVIIIGVSDDGAIIGVGEEPDNVQERLTNILQTGLNSPVSARIDKYQHSTGWVHWIEVPRQRGFEPLRYDGRVWVRRGRASVEPSPSELQELYNLFGYILTEERVIGGTSANDIDYNVFREFLRIQSFDIDEDPQPFVEQDLLNRGVIDEIGDGLQATLYGILCFGKDPQEYPQTRDAWIDCVAYSGDDRASDVILTGEAKGRADEQVKRALGWMRSLGRFERYEGILRTDIPLVPEKAMREALVNAVAHRDYAIHGSKILLEIFQDRVVVTSPGVLPNRMTPESALAGGHPRSRNELIANFMLVMRLMERRGRGLPIIRKAMREFNQTEPEMINNPDGPYVRLTLYIQKRSITLSG